MAKNPNDMPAIINRKNDEEKSEDLLETKSEGEGVADELKEDE